MRRSTQPSILQVYGRLLADGPLSVDDMMEATPLAENTITVALSQLSSLGKVTVARKGGKGDQGRTLYKALA